jgi:hypothetical protein
MRLLKFGRPELPLVILATFLSSISAFLHMSQNVFVGMVINTVHYNTLEAGQRSLTTFTLVLLSIYIGDCLSSLFAGVRTPPATPPRPPLPFMHGTGITLPPFKLCVGLRRGVARWGPR